MATYSIRDLEKISGIKAHTLRMWEQRYEILNPKRTDTNIRYYEEADLRLLLSISMLNCSGYKISRIAKMSCEEIHETCQQLQNSCKEYAHQVNSLTLAMIEMDEIRFEKVISGSTLRYGFEATMMQIVYPFFNRVGVLWQTGTIRPAQEHFVSNLLRQKLIVAIDGQVVPRDPSLPLYLLFLPEHEMHENGLLFVHYLLRSRGNRVIFLGASVPECDLESIVADYQPDYLVTHLTMIPPKESAEAYLTRIGNRFGKRTLISGGAALEEANSLPKNVKAMAGIGELVAYIEGQA